ncbi:kinase-like protein [Venturia nashicola]|nr:kinase-like protein [Venturia nashicola]
MSKRRLFEVDGHQIAPPSKFRKILSPFQPIKAVRPPAAPVLQIPTPERSLGTASTSTTASKPDPLYEVPQKYSLITTMGTLGSGGQARAVLCQGRGSKQFVVKFFKKWKYAVREAKIIRQIHGSAGSAANSFTLNHPRIVGLQDGPYSNFPGHLLTTDGPEWAILLEYAKGHTLSNCKSEYMKLSRAVPEMLIWKYFYQMAEALAFMHWGYGTREFDPKNPYGREYSFVHRDLKPDNVLRTSTPGTAVAASNTWGEPYPNIQLCDFGMSDKITKDEFNDIKTGGSEYWQPPEQCQAPNIAGPAQDVWAMGAIIHYLALGEPPCDGTNSALPLEEGANWRASLPRKVTSISMKPQDRTSMFKDVMTGHLRTEFHKADADKKWGGTYSQLLDHYMQRCLQLDAKNRATSWEILMEMGGVYKDLMEKCKGSPSGFTRRVRNMSV